MYSYCWCFIRIYTLHMYIESLSVVIVFSYLCFCVYHCKQIHKQMQDLKGVCSPHLVLILYSPSWLVLVLSPFMSLTQFHPSFCPVFGSWGCGSYHRAGPRTIVNYWFRHWNQIINMFGWFRGHHFCRSPTYFRQQDIFAGLFSSVGRSSTHSSIGGVELGWGRNSWWQRLQNMVKHLWFSEIKNRSI